jgi:opacity protein-like surface antigen
MTTFAAALLLLLLAASPALAFDPAQTFRKGATVLSLEGGAGHQENLEGHRVQTGLDLWYLGLRYSWLPFEPAGPSVLRGSFEIGLEPVLVNYYDPVDAFYAGLGFRLRWHFLSLGRFVPYLEGGAAAGGTDLEVREVDSTFAFLLSFGAGASVFVTDRVALYAGYRLVHVSNGNIDSPNRGFEAHTGLFGVSYYFK